jgi:hypothetical protein
MVAVLCEARWYYFYFQLCLGHSTHTLVRYSSTVRYFYSFERASSMV